MTKSVTNITVNALLTKEKQKHIKMHVQANQGAKNQQ